MTDNNSNSASSFIRVPLPEEGPTKAMVEEAAQRVEQMEVYKDELEEALPALESLAQKLEEIRQPYQALDGWYQHDWLKDYELDEKGLFGDLRRGVLSEDGLYNLFEEYRQLALRIETVLAGFKPESDKLENKAPDPVDTEDPVL